MTPYHKYISITRVVDAAPMSRGDYNKHRGWPIPKDEDPEDAGYHVTSKDYETWTPNKQFEEFYRVHSTEGLTFGDAIEALKQGKKVARKGWNGKGMFLFLLPAGTIPKSAIHDGALKSVVDEVEGDYFEALGSIRMWTTNSRGRKAILTGWLASQTDMLEEDWMEVN